MRFIKVFLLFLALLIAACTFAIKPVPMNAQIGNVGVLTSDKLPLNVAVVVPDPPTHRIYWTPHRHPTMDQTGQMNEHMWPLNNELARAAKEAFSQGFASATLLRQIPMPGSNYDLIIILKLKEVHMLAGKMGPVWSYSTVDLYYVWNLSVIDNEGVEILRREDRSQTKSFDVDTNMERYTANWGQASSELMSEMVKSICLMVYNSREINEFLDER